MCKECDRPTMLRYSQLGWLAPIFLIFLLFIATGCDQQTATVRVPVTLGVATQPSSALLFVALEQGLFEQEGLEVSVVRYPSGKRALHEGLFQGKVDMTATAEVPITYAGFTRDDFRILATLFHASNVNRVVTRKDLGIKTPGDLKGRRIATQKASAVHFFLHLFLLEQNIGANDYEATYLKAEALPGALATGDIDAFSMREPYVTKARELLSDNALVFEAPGIYKQAETLVVREALLRKHPVVIDSVLAALLKAESFIQKHPRETVAIVASQLGVEKSKIEAILPEYTLTVELEQGLLLLLEDEARWAIDEGLAQGPLPDYLHLIHSEPLRRLAPTAVSIIR